jgi:hypothetical protein
MALWSLLLGKVLVATTVFKACLTHPVLLPTLLLTLERHGVQLI